MSSSQRSRSAATGSRAASRTAATHMAIGATLILLLVAASAFPSGRAQRSRIPSDTSALPGVQEALYERMEEPAAEISQTIELRHRPHGTILDPVFADPLSNDIVAYSRAGDSAIWTGHYLAAESYRYAVTGSPDALRGAEQALNGIRLLVEISGTGLLARAAVPVDWPFAQSVLSEEAQHGSYQATWQGRDYYWIGNTSRDQYCGVFFGLSVAYELLDRPELRSSIRALATTMLEFLLQNGWLVRMPQGPISTLFHLRPEQQLTLLQIGRQVNPDRFASVYRRYRALQAGLVTVALATDTIDDHNSYFQFNLNAINLFSLIRLEDRRWYRNLYRYGYDLQRRTTDDHGNAHFNMIDHALNGPDNHRDRETIEMLREWLQRPRRDPFTNFRGVVPTCGHDRACDPLPIPARVRTDFLWQRSPFLIFGGGLGTIEGPGIDFILPYWMARFYGVLGGEQPPAEEE